MSIARSCRGEGEPTLRGPAVQHLRGLAELASKPLGQNIIVENQPAGGGTPGPGGMALSAKPDGYTPQQFPLCMMRIPHRQTTQWNPLTDFSCIIGLTGCTFGVTVRADSPYKTFNDCIEAARKQAGKIDHAPTGIGTTLHLQMEEVAFSAKLTYNHVPVKGNAAAWLV